MRDIDSFAKYMLVMSEIFEKRISKLLLDIYWEILKEYTDHQCTRAFEYLIRNAKHFPLPADIIEAIAVTSPWTGVKQDDSETLTSERDPIVVPEGPRRWRN